MKVLLVKNVKGLGVSGKLVDVAIGFASNYLIPQGLAKLPSIAEEVKAKDAVLTSDAGKTSVEFKEYAKMVVAKLNGKTLLFSAKASDKGHLFGSISEKDIVGRVKSDYEIDLTVDQVVLGGSHLKNIGDNRVQVVLSSDYSVAITVRIEASK